MQRARFPAPEPDGGVGLGPRLGRTVGRWARILAAGLALVVASVVLVTPTPAYADTPNRELGSGYTNLRVDVIWGSTEPYQGVFLWPDNDTAAQRFDLLDSGGGFFRIRARHSGQCLMLDWRAGYYTNGTPIIQYPHCSAGYSPAEWYTQEVMYRPCVGNCFPGWFHLIKNRATGRCLDAQGPSGRPAVESMLQQWDCIGATTDWNAFNQMWNIIDPVPPILG